MGSFETLQRSLDLLDLLVNRLCDRSLRLCLSVDEHSRLSCSVSSCAVELRRNRSPAPMLLHCLFLLLLFTIIDCEPARRIDR